MLRIAAVLVFTATAVSADQCTQAKNLSANYWSLIGGMAEILKTCENDTSQVCQIARATDEQIKETGTPNGTMLLMMLPLELC